MIKDFFHKINNFIQWTKKWHFFHFIAIGNILLFSLIVFITILSLETDPTEDIFLNIISLPIMYISLLLYLALPIAIIIMYFNLKKGRKITIYNKFLLNNEIYNITYIASLLIIISSLIINIKNGFIIYFFIEIFIFLIEYAILLPLYYYLYKRFQKLEQKQNILL